MNNRALREDLIRAKLAEIEESVELVRENMPDSSDEFSRLGLIKDGIYKRMEYAIENVFDICAIINADLKLELPDSDEGVTECLTKRGILTNEMKDKLKRMKGFRNIVVHRYGRIDDSIAYEILDDNLDDFYLFVDYIERFLNNTRKEK